MEVRPIMVSSEGVVKMKVKVIEEGQQEVVDLEEGGDKSTEIDENMDVNTVKMDQTQDQLLENKQINLKDKEEENLIFDKDDIAVLELEDSGIEYDMTKQERKPKKCVFIEGRCFDQALKDSKKLEEKLKEHHVARSKKAAKSMKIKVWTVPTVWPTAQETEDIEEVIMKPESTHTQAWPASSSEVKVKQANNPIITDKHSLRMVVPRHLPPWRSPLPPRFSFSVWPLQFW